MMLYLWYPIYSFMVPRSFRTRDATTLPVTTRLLVAHAHKLLPRLFDGYHTARASCQAFDSLDAFTLCQHAHSFS